ncbi:MAG TPA: PIG-L deacetylase family protein [bacterium]|nr:PIG-L deacetylase family protein [bacterium]
MDTRRCLILAPHQDDEVLGCGGTIARKVRKGTQVSIAFMTDGRRGVPAAAEEARILREGEALDAAEILGVPRARLAFLRYEDRRLSEHVDEATQAVRQMVSALGVEELFVPYRKDFHPDHIATWQIGRASCPPGGRLYEYPIWYGPWIWNRLRGWSRVAAASQLADSVRGVKVCVADVAAIKRQALAAYRSQLTEFEPLGPWGSRFLEGFSGSYEVFFVHR